MATLLNLRPMLWVDDVRTSIDWYVKTLDFREDAYSEEWGWGTVEKDGVQIMFAKPNEHLPYNGPAFTGSFYLNTDDVEAWWQKLKESPQVYYGLEEFDYGMKEFAVKDCNGYILQFGQEIER